MTGYHAIYGLYLESDLPVPGLPQLPSIPRTDVKVWFGSFPSEATSIRENAEIHYTSSALDESGRPTSAVWKSADGNFFYIHYSDGIEFIVNRSGTEVWAIWPATMSAEDTATYLLGPVLGFLLQLRKTVALHASAINIGHQAVVLFGEAGAGKSTTAAAFALRGCPVLAEDVTALLPLPENFLVQPGYPLIRLWPESVEMLFGSPEALPLLTPNWNKRYLDLTKDSYRFQQEPLPLSAIYLLEERSDNWAAPFIESVLPQEALIRLVSNTYGNYLLDKAARAHEFEVLGQLLKYVPVRRVIPHRDPARLSDLCDVILSDFHALSASTAAAS